MRPLTPPRPDASPVMARAAAVTVAPASASRAQHQAEYNALMDAARARAVALRREAVQTFWRGVGVQTGRGLRALYRLSQRLARHLMQRGAPAGSRQLEV